MRTLPTAFFQSPAKAPTPTSASANALRCTAGRWTATTNSAAGTTNRRQEQKMSKEMPDLQLFPPIEPYRTGMMPVDELHTLYWEESGNPDGVPVVYVHGGPGGGASPEKRQWFDPSYYRIVLYDQRGAFRS